MKIAVTQEHIDAGKRGICMRCPVALALRAKGIHAFVRTKYISVGRVEWLRVPLPRVVSEKILAFDFNGTMEPFEFELEGI